MRLGLLTAIHSAANVRMQGVREACPILSIGVHQQVPSCAVKGLALGNVKDQWGESGRAQTAMQAVGGPVLQRMPRDLDQLRLVTKRFRLHPHFLLTLKLAEYRAHLSWTTAQLTVLHHPHRATRHSSHCCGEFHSQLHNCIEPEVPTSKPLLHLPHSLCAPLPLPRQRP